MMIGSRWSRKDMCIFLLSFDALHRRLESHLEGHSSKLLLECSPSIVDVMDMFVENMVASGDAWKCNSQELAHLLSSFSGVQYQVMPAFLSALIGYVSRRRGLGV